MENSKYESSDGIGKICLAPADHSLAWLGCLLTLGLRVYFGATQMVQLLRTHTILTEDPSSVLTPTLRGSQLPITPGLVRSNASGLCKQVNLQPKCHQRPCLKKTETLCGHLHSCSNPYSNPHKHNIKIIKNIFKYKIIN